MYGVWPVCFPGFDLYVSRISVAEKTRVFGLNSPLHAWLEPWPTANAELVSNSMVWLSAHAHILAYHSTSIPVASSVFLLRSECSGKDKTRRKKRDDFGLNCPLRTSSRQSVLNKMIIDSYPVLMHYTPNALRRSQYIIRFIYPNSEASDSLPIRHSRDQRW